MSQPGVDRQVIGVAGAGWLGVLYSVEVARRHPQEIKSLVRMSGETLRDGLQFLHQASQSPELFVFSDEHEYPPTQDAMKTQHLVPARKWSTIRLPKMLFGSDMRRSKVDLPPREATERICFSPVLNCRASSLIGL
jgi:hypothetical protein